MKRKNLTEAVQIDNSIYHREEFIGDFKESTSMSIWLNIDGDGVNQHEIKKGSVLYEKIEGLLTASLHSEITDLHKEYDKLDSNNKT